MDKIKDSIKIGYKFAQQILGFFFFWSLVATFLFGGNLSIKMEDGIIFQIIKLFK